MNNQIKPTTLPKKIRIENFRISQILVGLHLSDSDLKILKYLNFLTDKIKPSAAFFMHVIPEFNILTALYSNDTIALGEMFALNEDIIKKMQSSVRANIKLGKDTYVDYIIKEGNLLHQFLEVGNEINADLLVIGQDSNDDYHGIWSKNMVRETHTNTLIIPEQSKCQLKTILVAVDFSPSSKKALHTALALQNASDTPVKVVCLHIFSLPNKKTYTNISLDDLRAITQLNIKNTFVGLVDSFDPRKPYQIETVTLEQRMPTIADNILEYAKTNKADLLIMGSRGTSVVESLSLGSVAEELINQNKFIPTLIIK